MTTRSLSPDLGRERFDIGEGIFSRDDEGEVDGGRGRTSCMIVGEVSGKV